MSNIPSLEDQIYAIAKYHVLNLVNTTLLLENWEDRDFERRYLSYIKDFIEIRKVVEANNLTLQKLTDGLKSISSKKSIKTKEKLIDSLIGRVKMYTPIDRSLGKCQRFCRLEMRRQYGKIQY